MFGSVPTASTEVFTKKMELEIVHILCIILDTFFVLNAYARESATCKIKKRLSFPLSGISQKIRQKKWCLFGGASFKTNQ